MEHIHLKECESTQDFAIELLKSKENFIISCELQTKGKGQGGKTWDALGNCVSFSFDLGPSSPISLTSLELGVLVCKFFEKFYNLTPKLKWPNDILNNSKQKCGGILINNSSQSKMIAGIGINLSSKDIELKTNYKVPAGFIFSKSFESDKETLCYNLTQFIHQNRLTDIEIINQWNNRCAHIHKKVMIFDESKEVFGTFKQVGKFGQAIIETSHGLEEFYSGSLKILS